VQRKPDRIWSAFLILAAFLLLAGVYLFQRTNLIGPDGGLFTTAPPNLVFVANRVVRLILNDFACFLLIYALFKEYKYLKIAFIMFLVELLFILPIYFLLKLSLEGDSEISSPLLSLIHRLIVNPTLMLLLIAGFVYQKNLPKR
jgi:exosortase F-associated protein